MHYIDLEQDAKINAAGGGGKRAGLTRYDSDYSDDGKEEQSSSGLTDTMGEMNSTRMTTAASKVRKAGGESDDDSGDDDDDITIDILAQRIPALATTGIFLRYDKGEGKLIYNDADGNQQKMDV